MRGRPVGRPKTPTALAVLRGNPGRRPLNTREPKPGIASTDPPSWIVDDALALELWNESAPELVRLGLLTRLDRRALASACKWWSLYQRAQCELDGELTVESRNNGWQAKPELRIALQAYQAAFAAFTQFGMSGPSSRANLHSPEPEQQRDEFENLLQKREASGATA